MTSYRMMAGGAFFNDAPGDGSSSDAPKVRYDYLGLRCARTP
jgi:hypothetical protein